MRLYQTVVENDEETKVVWSGSQAEASKTRAEFKKAGHKHPDTTEVDVPTNKTDLLKFLNDMQVVI